MSTNTQKHWSNVEYLSETITNANIHVKGTKSYYSDAYTGCFQTSVVRYLYGDPYSVAHWEPLWEIDQLFIGNFVCIAPEVVILMGGNSTHRMDWISLYPFMESIQKAYIPKGDTVIQDGVWIGMRAMILPGIQVAQGAVIAAGSVVTKDVAPYSIVAGNPAKEIGLRFAPEIIQELLALDLYALPEEVLMEFQSYLSSDNLELLREKVVQYRSENSKF